LINKLKKILPKKVKNILRNTVNKPIFNFYNKNYSKKALLSYIVYPFKKGIKNSHTNYFEATTWAKLLDELGYCVDIVHYNNISNKIKIEKYDVVCGFGEVFEKYIYTLNAKAKTIIYATGMHNCWQNHITLKRLKNVYEKKGVWLGDSSRYVDVCYSAHVSYADAVIALGNEICANSYKPYNKNVFQLNAPFFKTYNYETIIKNKKEDFNKHFLWFGSRGAVHKGLDLVLDYFSKREDLYLHICGNIINEKNFCEVYKKELFESKNIFYYGFVDIKSGQFQKILQQCGFVIFPSCSEGGGVSVLTCIGNGGLIPIITKETTINTGYEIWIDGFSVEDIEKAVNKALLYKQNELISLMYKNGKIISEKCSLESYEHNLKKILEGIL